MAKLARLWKERSSKLSAIGSLASKCIRILPFLRTPGCASGNSHFQALFVGTILTYLLPTYFANPRKGCHVSCVAVKEVRKTVWIPVQNVSEKIRRPKQWWGKFTLSSCCIHGLSTESKEMSCYVDAFLTGIPKQILGSGLDALSLHSICAQSLVSSRC